MENKGALLTVAIPLVAFKIWFAILLLMYSPTRDTMVWIAATHWTLLIVFGFMIVAAMPLYRLVKARAKRARLRRAEFMLEPDHPGLAARMTNGGGAQCPALWETVSRLEGDG
jgi:hypothetical protein